MNIDEPLGGLFLHLNRREHIDRLLWIEQVLTCVAGLVEGNSGHPPASRNARGGWRAASTYVVCFEGHGR